MNVAIIFTSLQFFNIIRTPLIWLPLVLASLSDVLVALNRLSKFLVAEELDEPYSYDPTSELAIDAEGDFTWEAVVKLGESKFDDKAKVDEDGILGEKEKAGVKREDEQPFGLVDLKLKIPKGKFVGIVGPIGCGKVRPQSTFQTIILLSFITVLNTPGSSR